MSYLDSVVNDNPTLASTYIADTTFEKRNLKVITLKSGSPSKAIWLGEQFSSKFLAFSFENSHKT